MITCENRVGRLIESRFLLPLTADEIAAFDAARLRLNAALRGARITVIDLSRASTLPADQIEPVITSLRRPGPPPLRSAMLLPTGGATFALQMARVNRETQHPTRRAFSDRVELESWLGEVLDAAERARLKLFLDGG